MDKAKPRLTPGNVERLAWSYDGMSLEEAHCADYVRFDDFAQVCDERDELLEDCKSLAATLGVIYGY